MRRSDFDHRPVRAGAVVVTLLALTLLLGQAQALAHVHPNADTRTPCAVCLLAPQLGHGLHATPGLPSPPTLTEVPVRAACASWGCGAPSPRRARAPPAGRSTIETS